MSLAPGNGGHTHPGCPVSNTVQDAVAATGADVSVIFVPQGILIHGQGGSGRVIGQELRKKEGTKRRKSERVSTRKEILFYL